MAIFVDGDMKFIIQGITGREGRFHTEHMVAYGTNVVAGVTPGKGGEWVDSLPVFDTVAAAVEATGGDASVIFVPARFAADAIFEAVEAGLKLVVCITEGIPVHDIIQVRRYIDARDVRVVGPNCPGLLIPGVAKVGIMPGHIATPGPVGVVSRSGTLTYEVVYALTQRGLGQSACIGIGGDPINGTNFIDCLRAFEDDHQTEKIVMIGEIGGTAEEQAAAFIKEHVTKPVVGFIAGRTAPPGRRMGHAGAIVEGGRGTATDKIAALEAAGVKIAKHPEAIPDLLV